MLEVTGNVIRLTRGDSATLNVTMKRANGTAYTMASGDTLTMTVRKTPTSSILLQVESTTNVITLDADDTADLEVGSCCYDIQLDTADGKVYTVVGLTSNVQANMVVLSEVTY